MAGVKGLILFALTALLGCADTADPLRAALGANAPHFATRIENPSRAYIATEVKTIAGPVEMNSEWSNRFDRLLGDLLDQFGGEAYACAPNPGVKVTIASVDQTFRFLICFECSLVTILDGNGAKVKELPFDKRHDELGKLVMEAFSDDKKLADVIDGKAPTN